MRVVTSWIGDFIDDPAHWTPAIILVGVFLWFVFDSRKKITQAMEKFTRYLAKLDEQNKRLSEQQRSVKEKSK